MLPLQETKNIHDFMIRPKMESIAYITFYSKYLKLSVKQKSGTAKVNMDNQWSKQETSHLLKCFYCQKFNILIM